MRGASGPGDADAETARGGLLQPVPPVAAGGSGDGQIGGGARNRLQTGRAGPGEGQQGAVPVPGGVVRGEVREQGHPVAKGPFHQPQGGRRTDETDLGETSLDLPEVADKLKGIAKALFGEDQQTLVVGFALAGPLGQGARGAAVTPLMMLRGAGPAGLIVVPAGDKVAQLELRQAQVEPGHGQVWRQVHGSGKGVAGLGNPTEVLQHEAEAVEGRRKGGLEGEGALIAGAGLGKLFEAVEGDALEMPEAGRLRRLIEACREGRQPIKHRLVLVLGLEL